MIVPPRLIIEGSDGTGKTTVAKRIAEQIGAHYIHAGAPTAGSIEDEYLAPLLDLGDGPVVIDRWQLGEWIWPDLFERESLYQDWEHLVTTCDNLARLGYTMWVVHRKPLEMAGSLVERGEKPGEIMISILAQESFMSATTDLQAETILPIHIVESDDLMEVIRWEVQP